MKTLLNYCAVAICLAFGASAAQAADVYQAPTTPRYEATPRITTNDWTGIYFGVLAGWTIANHDVDTNISAFDDDGEPLLIPSDLSTPNFSTDSDGFNFGLQLGSDVQLGNRVIGVVADVSYTDIEARGSAPFTLDDVEVARTSFDSTIEWLGTVRLRAGYLVDPDILVYATGGLAWAISDTSFNTELSEGFEDRFGPVSGVRSTSTDRGHLGWTVGAGVEAALFENVRLKLEYLYVDLGSQDYDVNSLSNGDVSVETNADVDLDLHVIRAGLAYQF